MAISSHLIMQLLSAWHQNARNLVKDSKAQKAPANLSLSSSYSTAMFLQTLTC